VKIMALPRRDQELVDMVADGKPHSESPRELGTTIRRPFGALPPAQAIGRIDRSADAVSTGIVAVWRSAFRRHDDPCRMAVIEYPASEALRPKVAVVRTSFDVAEGEIFGILGPNGAGKTTTVECVAGLRKQDGGTIASWHGPPPGRAALRARIGVQLQESQLPNDFGCGRRSRCTPLLSGSRGLAFAHHIRGPFGHPGPSRSGKLSAARNSVSSSRLPWWAGHPWSSWTS